MMEEKIECKYLGSNGSCFGVLENDEAKLARKANCENANEAACCYLCDFMETCDISCNYLGETRKPGRHRERETDQEREVTLALRCELCGLKMRPARTKLRIGGWEGLTKVAVGGVLGREISDWGEMEEELLPVIIHFCPKCGRMELVAEKKTKEKLFKLFNLSLM